MDFYNINYLLIQAYLFLERLNINYASKSTLVREAISL